MVVSSIHSQIRATNVDHPPVSTEGQALDGGIYSSGRRPHRRASVHTAGGVLCMRAPTLTGSPSAVKSTTRITDVAHVGLSRVD